MVDINSIKRKLLIKYPTFGSTVANLEFKEDESIETAGTDGKVLLYNPTFVSELASDKKKIFLFAHEVCHVAFKHISRSKGKEPTIWNIATDAVINAQLKADGLPMIEGGVDIPEAINYDAEEMYNKLLEEKKKQSSKSSNEKNNEQKSKEKKSDVGHDTHSLWEKAIEDLKEEKEKTDEEKERDKLVQKGEKETFKQNKIERRKRLQELNKELAEQTSHGAGTGIQRQGKKLDDIGIAKPLIDWRRLLKHTANYNEEWTRKNARMRNGYFRHKIIEKPISETEILLDTSGSVSEYLLRNFLKECKNIFSNSKVKVGCFNTKFHGFTELRRIEDIDDMRFPIGGGTDFDVAVKSFSRGNHNKIIFTDGKATMPKEVVRDVIWVVYGNEPINPKGGKVIHIDEEKLYKFVQESNSEKLSR